LGRRRTRGEDLHRVVEHPVSSGRSFLSRNLPNRAFPSLQGEKGTEEKYLCKECTRPTLRRSVD
jgi:hypothetical protein